MIGIHEDTLFLWITSKHALAACYLQHCKMSNAGEEMSHVISFTEEERRKSVELMMNQSSFLEQTILSNSSGVLSNGSNSSSKMSISGTYSQSSQGRKVKPRPLLSPEAGSYHPSPTNQYNNDTLQHLLGVKSSNKSANKSIRQGYKRSLQVALHGPRSSSPTVLRRSPSLQLNLPQEADVNNMSSLQELDSWLSQVSLESLHHEVYFHIDADIKCELKATFVCEGFDHINHNHEIELHFSHFLTRGKELFVIHLLEKDGNYCAMKCFIQEKKVKENPDGVRRDVSIEFQEHEAGNHSKNIDAIACFEIPTTVIWSKQNVIRIPCTLLHDSQHQHYLLYVGNNLIRKLDQLLNVEDDIQWIHRVLQASPTSITDLNHKAKPKLVGMGYCASFFTLQHQVRSP